MTELTRGVIPAMLKWQFDIERHGGPILQVCLNNPYSAEFLIMSLLGNCSQRT